jgi:hypothetical protein
VLSCQYGADNIYNADDRVMPDGSPSTDTQSYVDGLCNCVVLSAYHEQINRSCSLQGKEIEDNCIHYCQVCSTPSRRVFVKYPTGIPVSENHVHGTAIGYRIHKNLKTYIASVLVNYILEKIQANLLTSSTANEVPAWFGHVESVHLSADSW